VKQSLNLFPRKAAYHTREHLYALCVLLLWAPGISLANTALSEGNTVTLHGVEGGNAGVSHYLLKNNPNATDIRFEVPGENSYTNVLFKILGVPVVATFDEDGVGVVQFLETDLPF
jgi:hypothetical protein